MEKLILTSPNFSNRKIQSKGSFNLFEKLKSLADFDNVHLEAEIPDFDIIIKWEEFQKPNYNYRPFLPIVSAKLTNSPFQYLANFVMNEKKIECPEEGFCENYEAKLNGNTVYKTDIRNSSLLNCTWLFEFLFHTEKLASDPYVNESLIWQKRKDGYELVLESQQNNGKLTERQIFLSKHRH